MKKEKKSRVYIALLHYPVYNKKKEIVTTSITGFDLHDIARSALTFGILRYYVVNPLLKQREFAQRIIDCWRRFESFKFNPTRYEAFEIVKIVPKLEDAVSDIVSETGEKPKIVSTSAKPLGKFSYKKLRNLIEKDSKPYLILFGTGWGIDEKIVKAADIILEPIYGKSQYRHLSVRSAVAIILDRLFGRRE